VNNNIRLVNNNRVQVVYIIDQPCRIFNHQAIK